MFLFGKSSGNKVWSPSKYSRLCSQHFVNDESSVENPIPTMNLVYDRYESNVKKSSFFGVEKPFAVSKNNVVILVACSFCTLSFCFHSLWFILIFSVDCKLKK